MTCNNSFDFKFSVNSSQKQIITHIIQVIAKKEHPRSKFLDLIEFQSLNQKFISD